MKPKPVLDPQPFRSKPIVEKKPKRTSTKPGPTTKASGPQLWRLNANGLLRVVPLEERDPGNAILSADVWETVSTLTA
ncbi:MAG TPA: hypothetical protein VFM96_10125 [Gaiellaceae bacterium]|nr:hypothetical protein [Gaiellaceae bacterium]